MQNSERKQTATTQGSLLRVSGHSVTVRTLLQSASGLSGPYTTSRTFVLCFPTTSTPHASQPLLAQPHNGTARTAPPRTHRARGTNSVQLDSLNSPRGPRPRTAPTPSEKSHETSHITHFRPMIPSHQLFQSCENCTRHQCAPSGHCAPRHQGVAHAHARCPNDRSLILTFSSHTHIHAQTTIQHSLSDCHACPAGRFVRHLFCA